MLDAADLAVALAAEIILRSLRVTRVMDHDVDYSHRVPGDVGDQPVDTGGTGRILGERRDRRRRATRNEQKPRCWSDHRFPPCFVCFKERYCAARLCSTEVAQKVLGTFARQLKARVGREAYS
jgi:hypothetical protein